MLTTKWYQRIRYGQIFIFQIDVKETAKQYQYIKSDKQVQSFDGKTERESWVVSGSRFSKMDPCLSDTYEEAYNKIRAQLNARVQRAKNELEKELALLEVFNSVEYIKQ